MKTKIKSHGNEVTDFYNKEILKADSNHICLTVISLDSAFNKDENYYQQVFLKSINTFKKRLLDLLVMT